MKNQGISIITVPVYLFSFGFFILFDALTPDRCSETQARDLRSAALFLRDPACSCGTHIAHIVSPMDRFRGAMKTEQMQLS